MMIDPRVARLKIMRADERVAELRCSILETETMLEALRRELVAVLDERAEAMGELHWSEVYI